MTRTLSASIAILTARRSPPRSRPPRQPPTTAQMPGDYSAELQRRRQPLRLRHHLQRRRHGHPHHLLRQRRHPHPESVHGALAHTISAPGTRSPQTAPRPSTSISGRDRSQTRQRVRLPYPRRRRRLGQAAASSWAPRPHLLHRTQPRYRSALRRPLPDMFNRLISRWSHPCRPDRHRQSLAAADDHFRYRRSTGRPLQAVRSTIPSAPRLTPSGGPAPTIAMMVRRGRRFESVRGLSAFPGVFLYRATGRATGANVVRTHRDRLRGDAARERPLDQRRRRGGKGVATAGRLVRVDLVRGRLARGGAAGIGSA